MLNPSVHIWITVVPVTSLLNIWLLFPSKIRLLSYQALRWLGLRLYGPTTSPNCFRLPFNLYAKVGVYVDMGEANALKYLSQCVGGLAPSLVDAIPVPTGAFIVMTGLPGKPLQDRLLRMSPQQRCLLASDLKHFFDRLRSIPALKEGPKICGIDGGSFVCYRLIDERIGPFGTEMDFYQFLYDRVYFPEQNRLKALAKPVHTRLHPICLHHNDLAPQNVLVDDNGRLTGIVDWAGLAWFPEYWEWTREYYHRELYPQWRCLMDEVFGRREEELAVEEEFWRFSDPW